MYWRPSYPFCSTGTSNDIGTTFLELFDKGVVVYSHNKGNSAQPCIDDFLYVVFTAAAWEDEGYIEMFVGEKKYSGFDNPSLAY